MEYNFRLEYVAVQLVERTPDKNYSIATFHNQIPNQTCVLQGNEIEAIQINYIQGDEKSSQISCTVKCALQPPQLFLQQFLHQSGAAHFLLFIVQQFIPFCQSQGVTLHCTITKNGGLERDASPEYFADQMDQAYEKANKTTFYARPLDGKGLSMHEQVEQIVQKGAAHHKVIRGPSGNDLQSTTSTLRMLEQMRQKYQKMEEPLPPAPPLPDPDKAHTFLMGDEHYTLHAHFLTYQQLSTEKRVILFLSNIATANSGLNEPARSYDLSINTKDNQTHLFSCPLQSPHYAQFRDLCTRLSEYLEV